VSPNLVLEMDSTPSKVINRENFSFKSIEIPKIDLNRAILERSEPCKKINGKGKLNKHSKMDTSLLKNSQNSLF